MFPRKFILGFLLLISITVAEAQVHLSSDALVKVDFNTPYYIENFDSVSADWPTFSNFNNLFMIQNGSYYMNRKAKVDPYALLSSKKVSTTEFQINLIVNPIEISNDGFIGLLFMLQESSAGGFIFEIGAGSRYRLRQIRDGIYRTITGDLASKGWITDENLIKYNTNNNLTIAKIGRAHV